MAEHVAKSKEAEKVSEGKLRGILCMEVLVVILDECEDSRLDHDVYKDMRTMEDVHKARKSIEDLIPLKVWSGRLHFKAWVKTKREDKVFFVRLNEDKDCQLVVVKGECTEVDGYMVDVVEKFRLMVQKDADGLVLAKSHICEHLRDILGEQLKDYN